MNIHLPELQLRLKTFETTLFLFTSIESHSCAALISYLYFYRLFPLFSLSPCVGPRLILAVLVSCIPPLVLTETEMPHVRLYKNLMTDPKGGRQEGVRIPVQCSIF